MENLNIQLKAAKRLAKEFMMVGNLNAYIAQLDIVSSLEEQLKQQAA